MKTLFILISWIALTWAAKAQIAIHDQAIINQQERMVFKSWDADKFTPKSGFLGLNPMYWITWGLHPNYPDTDLRPLGPLGLQTMRIGLIAAMKSAADAYKLHTDTLKNSALSNFVAYSGAVSQADPLWNLYYRSALAPLDQPPEISLSAMEDQQAKYLSETGLVLWYTEQHQALRERLRLARTLDMERGSRILLYHRLLMEYRRLQAGWEDKKMRSKSYLKLRSVKEKIQKRETPISYSISSDIQIANKVLKNSKL